MRKVLALLWLALSIAGAHAQDVSPALSLTSGMTPTNCTALNLFYDATGVLGCMAGTSWDNTNRLLTITTTGTGDIFKTARASTAAYFSIDHAGALTNFESFDDYTFSFSTGGERMRIEKETNNLGVGVTTPTQRITINSTGNFGIDDGAGTADLIFGRKAAASFRLGAAAAASPVAQKLSVQGSSGTNVAAASAFTIEGPLATGDAAPGDIILQTGVVGASGTTASTATTALTIKGTSQNVIAAAQIVPGTVTVAALPTGVEGGLINVSDQLTACPAKGGTFTGGGAVTCLAHFEEGAWVAP